MKTTLTTQAMNALKSAQLCVISEPNHDCTLFSIDLEFDEDKEQFISYDVNLVDLKMFVAALSAKIDFIEKIEQKHIKKYTKKGLPV